MASFGYALDVSAGFYSGISLRTSRSAGLTLRGALLREVGRSSQTRRVDQHRSFSLSRRNGSSSSGSDEGPGSSSSSSGSSSHGDSTPPTSPEPTPRTIQQQQQPTLRFSIAASFIGKPQEGRVSKSVGKLSEDSPIARWRDELLDKHGRLAKQRQSIKQKGKQKQSDQVISAGEDFFFVSESSHQDPAATSIVGVADGVGGWSESGIDSSIFSQALMFYANKAASQKTRSQNANDAANKDSRSVYPHDILHTAYKDLLEEKEVVAGSSTACIITLDPVEGIMRAANLGDSSFSLIRDSSVVHTQPPQTHYFNCPYQLSKLPNHLAGDPSSITNTPMQADLFETKLQKGDLVLCYTDGFGDNVWMKELEELYKTIMVDDGKQSLGLQKVEKLADTLVSYARICSEKTDKPSPFEHEARKHKLIYKGGKVDDICLIAILVDSA